MPNIILNPDYVLKPDDGKALIMATFVGRNSQSVTSDSFTNIIHPIYAMILSFINGQEHDECIRRAATELDVPVDLVSKFVDSLTDNPEQVYFKSAEGTSAFPPNTIITTGPDEVVERYTPELFEYDKVNMQMGRHKTPSALTLMLNNICMTDCIYCYQDKTRKVGCTIPLDRIIELIHEAHSLHVTTFDVIGGEFSLYEHWREVLRELRKFGYHPYLSTKIPLSEDDIKYLAELKVHDIQVSVDSLIEDHLIKSLKVKKGYVEKLKHSLSLLDKYGVPTMVHSVLTQYNDSIEDMQSVYDTIKDMKHLVDWHVVKGDPTLYPKTDYSNIEINQSKMNSIIDFLAELNGQNDIIIRYPSKAYIPTADTQLPSEEDKEARIKSFFSRSMCSGLFSSLYILPDGQVTMCEQLYWNKRFIIGNVKTQSIAEIWNSEKANKIYNITQEDIPEDSLCHTCDKFEICRSVRQVCYRDIIQKYGTDKWYYPDVNCPYANK